MQDFKRLKVWVKAHDLVIAVYWATEKRKGRQFPGLISQICRAAGSIPSNIAEGCGHDGSRQLAHFLEIAAASACELEYHLLLAADLGLIPRTVHNDLDRQIQEVKRMLTAFKRQVRAKNEKLDASRAPKAAPDATNR
jgi:four helix bundle protein